MLFTIRCGLDHVAAVFCARALLLAVLLTMTVDSAA